MFHNNHAPLGHHHRTYYGVKIYKYYNCFSETNIHVNYYEYSVVLTISVELAMITTQKQIKTINIL